MYFEEKPYKRLDDMLEFTNIEIAKQNDDESTYRLCAELIKDAKKRANSCSLMETWLNTKIKAGRDAKVDINTAIDCMAQIAGTDFARILDGLKHYRLNNLVAVKMRLEDIVEVASPRQTDISESKLDKSCLENSFPCFTQKEAALLLMLFSLDFRHGSLKFAYGECSNYNIDFLWVAVTAITHFGLKAEFRVRWKPEVPEALMQSQKAS